MQITEEQLKTYTCNLQKKFMEDFYKENQEEFMFNGLIDTNKMLEHLYSYSEINDKSKEFYYIFSRKYFKDVTINLIKKYETKFGLKNCGLDLYNSFGCYNSNLLIDCNDIHNSFGCIKCKFSKHLLYCDGIKHEDYMAFNKKVTPKRFSELIKLNPIELKRTPEFNMQIYIKINSKIEFIYRLK